LISTSDMETILSAGMNVGLLVFDDWLQGQPGSRLCDLGRASGT
jgi:hypothetical protein